MAKSNMNSSAHGDNNTTQANSAKPGARAYRKFVKRSQARKQERAKRRAKSTSEHTYYAAEAVSPIRKKLDVIFRVFLVVVLSTTMVVLPTSPFDSGSASAAETSQAAEGDGAAGSQTPDSEQGTGGSDTSSGQPSQSADPSTSSDTGASGSGSGSTPAFLMAPTHPIPKQTTTQPHQTPTPTNLLLKASW